MKTIGLIGGMSWESSKLYYEYLNTGVRDLLGGAHSASCIMVSVDFHEIEALTQKGDWDGIGEVIKKAAQQLEAAGAEMILLCTNTIHLVSHYISDHVRIPFLHIASATGEAIRLQGLTSVALLGTKFTMEYGFYKDTLLSDYGLRVLTPGPSDRQVLHDMIYDELVRGVFTDSSKRELLRIIEELQGLGAQGIILGCTELPLLVKEGDVAIPLFDTGKIHAQQAVEWSIGRP